ncbi:amidohydrolase [Virgibacillus sp. SK37]|uniref:amidohydrolase n=1 Tax=Virgibacillus sp. SK37 TaxID=403957 RepID=UPI0004D1CCA3|nr:amidohydrolase [Virgibacillus sp. SK37]AIF44448.1 hypothetical protein X953_15820 [Virgibacillus sp. SK37]
MITPNLIIINANIITLDEHNTRGKSLAVTDGVIDNIWAHSEPPYNEIDLSRNPEIVDLRGKTLIPGFIDTHNHLLMYSLFRKQANCSTPPNHSIEEILKRIKNLAESTSDDEWVLGWGYDNTLLKEQRHPTRKELDKVVPDKPVFIRHTSVHFGVANSLALKLAGIDEQTEDPVAGFFGRDEEGNLDGVLHELPALEPMQAAIPVPTTEELANYIGEASTDYLAQGITTSTDAGVGLDFGVKELDAHLMAVERNLNPIRMRFMVLHHLLDKNGIFKNYNANQLNEEIKQRSLGKAHLDSAKFFQDGSIQGLTGALREPYYCEPEHTGELLHEQEKLNKEITELHYKGYRIATHGNGDRAIASIIEAYKTALNHFPHIDHRHRIEHVQTATDEDLDQIKELGIAASFFINHIYFWGDRHKRLFLGPNRAEHMNRLEDARIREILYTLHSDCPITPISPLFSIWVAVNRLTREGDIIGEHQVITVEEALRSMTIYGAKLNFEEDVAGSIEVGKRADFAVLDQDPTKINKTLIKDIQVEKTFIGGEIVFTREKVQLN